MFCWLETSRGIPHHGSQGIVKIFRGEILQFLCFQHHQRSYLEKIWSGLKTEAERNLMESALMDLSSLEAFGCTQVGTKKADATENK
jgi:hypothetical protein